KNGQAVMRLLTHQSGQQAQPLLLPAGYADPWMQRFLHWTAAGAMRHTVPMDGGVADGGTNGDAPPIIIADAPPTIDGPLPDAFVFPDGPPDNVPPTGGDVTAVTVDNCDVATLTISPGSDNVTPANQLRYQVCWATSSTACQTTFIVR